MNAPLKPLSPRQMMALLYPCLLAEETAHPQYGHSLPQGSLVLTVNAGYE